MKSVVLGCLCALIIAFTASYLQPDFVITSQSAFSTSAVRLVDGH